VTTLLLLHAGATLFMTGLVWFVQVVHYPLFDGVGRDSFVAYEIEHSRRTTRVVGPVMLVEGASAAALLGVRPAAIPASWAWVGFVLLGVVWISTVFLQVPQHRALERGFDGGVHRALVAGNWIRTIAWSARSVLALAMTAR
jgi:hypothetical protein